jgi:hypothetical protein
VVRAGAVQEFACGGQAHPVHPAKSVREKELLERLDVLGVDDSKAMDRQR